MTGPVICARLRVEAIARRFGLGVSGENGSAAVYVLMTGYWPVRSAAAAARLEPSGAGLAVAGVAGALADDLRVGDLVVASQVLGGSGPAVSCPSAPLLAGELRRAGLPVRLGPIATVDHLVGKGTRVPRAETRADPEDREAPPRPPGR